MVTSLSTYAVSGQDTSVNNVGADTSTSAVVVNILARGKSLMRDTAETPWRAALGDVGVDGDNSVLLNVLNLYQIISIKSM